MPWLGVAGFLILLGCGSDIAQPQNPWKVGEMQGNDGGDMGFLDLARADMTQPKGMQRRIVHVEEYTPLQNFQFGQVGFWQLKPEAFKSFVDQSSCYLDDDVREQELFRPDDRINQTREFQLRWPFNYTYSNGGMGIRYYAVGVFDYEVNPKTGETLREVLSLCKTAQLTEGCATPAAGEFCHWGQGEPTQFEGGQAWYEDDSPETSRISFSFMIEEHGLLSVIGRSCPSRNTPCPYVEEATLNGEAVGVKEKSWLLVRPKYSGFRFGFPDDPKGDYTWVISFYLEFYDSKGKEAFVWGALPLEKKPPM